MKGSSYLKELEWLVKKVGEWNLNRREGEEQEVLEEMLKEAKGKGVDPVWVSQMVHLCQNPKAAMAVMESYQRLRAKMHDREESKAEKAPGDYLSEKSYGACEAFLRGYEQRAGKGFDVSEAVLVEPGFDGHGAASSAAGLLAGAEEPGGERAVPAVDVEGVCGEGGVS